ncbi:Bone morphogenetic protein 2-B [Holothuria leucospilota]|uniref:Bone morphogenetic protein 2-B n=1 Tax=Holothuria leucospilota TaxID=206669 RepID=A0A9Q0YHT0_HOLLE|nr:Bone morphogenetic protein 2-B [Holothuria leucospilota]
MDSRPFLCALLSFFVCAPSNTSAYPTDFVQEFPELLDRNLNLPQDSSSQQMVQGATGSVFSEGAAISSESVTVETNTLEQISQVFGIANLTGIKAAGKGKRAGTPSFMLNLYNSVANSTNGEARAATPYLANTIRCVTNEKGRRKNRQVLQFKIDVVPPSERLLNAELYLFRLMSKLRDNSERRKSYQVSIYQRTNTEGTKLIDAKRVSSHGTGWETFNVGPSVREWFADPDTNLGFYINVTTLEGNAVPEGSIRFCLKNIERRPNLVLFTEDNTQESFSSVEGSFPNLPDVPVYPTSPIDNEPLPTHDVTPQHQLNKREVKPTDGDQKLCGLASMFVDFERLGWSDQIVAPNGFSANRCVGQCSFPAKMDIPYSTHALVQSFMAMETPEVGTACCVPHVLGSLTFLYFDDHSNIVLKRVRNAVAVKCGCH